MPSKLPHDPAHDGAAGPVLDVFDRAFLISLPLFLLGVLVAFPHSIATPWIVVTLASAGVVGAIIHVARRGGARWRGAAYAIIILVAATGALWDVGPFTGVGALFGLGILFAGAFLPRSWLVVAALVVLVSIAVRSLVPHVGGVLVVGSTYHTNLRMWIGMTIFGATIAWLALRVLEALIGSLERSHRMAEVAYRKETETREQLDRSRADLEELAQVQMVGRLAGGVAHDVNNALAAVLAASDVLTTEVTTPDQRRHLTELEAACHHAADLVRDLLWTGRKFPASTTEVANLLDVMRRCLERVRRVAREITVEHHIASDLDLAVSPEHIEQILFGLIVGADRTGVTHLVVTAAHEGPGIVVRLDGTVSEGSPAARLRAMQAKLSVSAARELIGQYAGTLDVAQTSTAVRIQLALPASRIASDVSLTALPRVRTALVVEDEPMVLRRLCQLVARRGYDVLAATNVAEALAHLATSPDLLITDLQLPDGSGEEIALVSFAQVPDRPIIVCSGFSAEDITRGPLRDAPLTFLAKPFTVSDFEAALGAVARPARFATERPA